MHTPQLHFGQDGTHKRRLGEYTSTDAKENTAHHSYTLSDNPRLKTHTFWEAANTLPNLGPNATTTHFDYCFNSYKNRMEAVAPS